MARHKLSDIPVATLQKEIQRRMSKLAGLIAQRDELNRQIADLGGAAVAAPKAARKPGRKARAPRAGGKTLSEYVRGVLAKAANGLHVREIEAKVLAAGYPTRAKTIYNPVMKVLAKGFKKVQRGIYALKAGAVAAMKKAAAAPSKGPRKRGQFAQTAQQLISPSR